MNENNLNNINDINSQKRLLIIDDEENMRHMLCVMLKQFGYIIDTAKDGQNGLELIEKNQYNFILCDLKMPVMEGMDFLKFAKDKIGSTTVIMMSAYGTIDTAIEAMKSGAYDYISKPFKTDEVYLALKKAEEREHLKKENLLLKKRIKSIEESYNFGKMVAKSRAMKTIFDLAQKVSNYSTTVLITGESGTGKELIAKGIHFSGYRAKMPFVPVNCGGVPESLMESEFFGHRKGAFTGADRNKKGLFEEAEGGTIFLDEIAELPLSLQVKLFRVLQENEIRPIGESKTKEIDVRIIAASAKDLESEVKQGRFREELFYRLNVLPIKLPPLRERTEDIPLLCEHFINKFKQTLEKDIKGISSEAMTVLLKYQWHGNVRELENSIERAVILAEEPVLNIENFPPEFVKIPEVSEIADNFFEGYSLKTSQKLLEKKLIIKALVSTAGNRSKATKLLEISHPSLLSKIKEYDINI